MPIIIAIIGASGIIAQITLVRELLVIFQGNELSLGLILANWLIAEALGSYFYRRFKISQRTYALHVLAFSAALPLLIILTRLIRPLVNVLPGEIITIPLMHVLTLLILLPVGFLHGGLFTSSVAVISQCRSNHNVKTPGFVYVIENVGTIIGGIIVSFLLIPNLSSLKIAFTVSVISLFAALIITKLRRSLLLYFSFLLLLLSAFGIYLSPQIENWTLRRNFPGYNILTSKNTIYNNITVVNRKEQLIFLVDHTPAVTVPYSNQYFIEDFVNFPLLQHPDPKKILLIGGGAGGTITKLLQYDITQIVYLELDPFLIQSIRDFSTSLTDYEISSPKVKIINTDARHYLENDTTRYDIILISFTNPSSLQTNRFFTKEFYASCLDRMNNNGILATLSPGSTAYTGPILSNLIQVHLQTLASVFPKTLQLTGDFNLYLSYKDKNSSQLDADSLYTGLINRRIATNLFSPGYIRYRLQNMQTGELNLNKSVPVNRDGLPAGLFYNLYYQNTVANPALRPIFDAMRKINIRILLILIIFVLSVFIILSKNRRSVYLAFAIFSTGITAMVFTLVFSLGFQIRYGYLYYQISILLTVFIAGSVAGGLVSNLMRTAKQSFFFISEISIILLLTTVILCLHNSVYPRLFNTQIDFLIFLFTAGFLVGFQFPLANRLFKQDKQSITTVVGSLYASDLLGGFVAAILIPVFLLPTIGIVNTLLVTILLKAASAMLVLTLR